MTAASFKASAHSLCFIAQDIDHDSRKTPSDSHSLHRSCRRHRECFRLEFKPLRRHQHCPAEPGSAASLNANLGTFQGIKSRSGEKEFGVSDFLSKDSNKTITGAGEGKLFKARPCGFVILNGCSADSLGCEARSGGKLCKGRQSS